MMDPKLMDELRREFIAETTENLDLADNCMVELEGDPGNAELLSQIFRTVHTVKGTGGLFGYSSLVTLAHSAENLLCLLCDGELPLTQEIATALLATFDRIRDFVANIERGTEGDESYEELVASLAQLSDLSRQAEDVTSAVGLSDSSGRDDDVSSAAGSTGTPAQADDVSSTVDLSDTSRPADDGPKAMGSSGASGQADDVSAAVGSSETSRQAEDTTSAVATATRPLERPATDAVTSSLRIEVALVDRLMNLAGELVLTRNRMTSLAQGGQNKEFVDTVQRLNHVTSELQDGVLKMRMQPISTVWGKVPRMVRDLALACGKTVRVQFEGSETELDKTVIDAFKDPLIHMVRNTIDHGIESPEERTAAGKPEEGLLVLRAFHESGQVNIEIIDDGRGIDLARLRSRAISRNLVTEDEAEELSSQEIANLIFLPGLTTADTLSDISGRGVGMDVVKTNIESIGGTIEVQTTPGIGTSIKIKIPLTLAIVPALIVRSAGERFALPQVHLREFVCMESNEAATTVEMVHGAPVFRIRNRLLPLVFLSKELGLTNEEFNAENIRRMDFGSQLVVLDAGGYSFGLVVDAIDNLEEIVVKPMPRQIKEVHAFAGTAVMGDGLVALILDIPAVAHLAQISSSFEDQPNATRDEDAALPAREVQSYLVVDTGHERRAAIPMHVVDRLEVFQNTAIETTMRGNVVQYRGSIMPLTPLMKLMGLDDLSEPRADSVAVIVCSHAGQTTGIVVPKIVDIVKNVVAPFENAADANGVVGTAVIQDRVTDLVDLETLLERATSTSTTEADIPGRSPLNEGESDE